MVVIHKAKTDPPVQARYARAAAPVIPAPIRPEQSFPGTRESGAGP